MGLSSKTDPASLSVAQSMMHKLESLDSEFHTHHFKILDLIDEADTDSPLVEQKVLDRHDDEVTNLKARLTAFINSCSSASRPSIDPSLLRVTTRKLDRLEKTVASISKTVSTMPDPVDLCLLRQLEEQLRDLKLELGRVADDLLNMDLPDSHDLSQLHVKLEEKVFDCGLQIKKALTTGISSTTSASVPVDKGVKLPKLDVPRFDGQLINWSSFWKQFQISVDEQSSLSESEKLVYLKQALKGGNARSVIEGLSRSGDQYKQAVESLIQRYDRPRIIHQNHVQLILDVPRLTDGSGKELRRLHDTVQQHLRALTAMGYEPSGPFITSAIELKLDANTMFEWQKFSQAHTAVPHYQHILEFVHLCAQASETSITEEKRNTPSNRVNHRSRVPPSKISSFTSTPVTESDQCSLCKNEKHQLFACPQFKSLPRHSKLSTLMSQDRCLNCLRVGHFAKQCKSLNHCRLCQKPHHTLLHVDHAVGNPSLSPTLNLSSPHPSSTTVTSNTVSLGVSSTTLLMTCQVSVRDSHGVATKCRALLDSASSASFVSERLAQRLHLPRSRHKAKIVGIAGLHHESTSQTVTRLVISPVHDHNREIPLTAVIMPRVTCDLPLQTTPFKPEWTHIAYLTFADPDFGQSDKIDLLLGVDVFAQVICHGRRRGPPGSPSAFETEFGWVLAGETESCVSHTSFSCIVTHHSTVATGDEILQRFWETEDRPGDQSNLSVQERCVVEHFKQHHSRTKEGQFMVPLAKKSPPLVIGESRSQAVRRFQLMECSLNAKGQFNECCNG